MDNGGGAPPFDPCECIFSHEGAMRRLISLVRNHLSLLSYNQIDGFSRSCFSFETTQRESFSVKNKTKGNENRTFSNTSAINNPLTSVKLRGSQSYCTEEQCFTDAPAIQPSNDGGGMTMMYVMMAWMIAAVLLYLLRPASMRGGAEKPSRNDNDRSEQPPAPTT